MLSIFFSNLWVLHRCKSEFYFFYCKSISSILFCSFVIYIIIQTKQTKNGKILNKFCFLFFWKFLTKLILKHHSNEHKTNSIFSRTNRNYFCLVLFCNCFISQDEITTILFSFSENKQTLEHYHLIGRINPQKKGKAFYNLHTDFNNNENSSQTKKLSVSYDDDNDELKMQ